MKRKEKSMSPSELIVMKVLWKEGRSSARVIVDQVAKQSDWHFRTVKTLLRKLVAKGFVDYTVDAQDARIYYYAPIVSEQQYLQQERQQFLQMYYDGDKSALLAGFLKDGGLTSAEAERLRQMLYEAKGEDGNE
ncbi:BlaI/MecI/CopY family transcriptional regulator [Paenibacillus sanguinis]|uniref:BlaI/MecI/CopY family transcriptional regulator n=1 Tax=Paenibacillus sanguinis TaxID=225906 RepID=UPI0003665117|nr:BlaI/MecI/CopY family transcriptional regulator [Paenibacillus sanguinis]